MNCVYRAGSGLIESVGIKLTMAEESRGLNIPVSRALKTPNIVHSATMCFFVLDEINSAHYACMHIWLCLIVVTNSKRTEINTFLLSGCRFSMSGSQMILLYKR